MNTLRIINDDVSSNYNKALLQKIYTNPASPGGYSGLVSLYNEAKRHDPKLTIENVKHFLEGQRTYSLFKQRSLNFSRSRTIPVGYMTDIQADLAGILNIYIFNQSLYNIRLSKLGSEKRWLSLFVSSCRCS